MHPGPATTPTVTDRDSQSAHVPRHTAQVRRPSKVVFATEHDDAREVATKLAPELEPKDFMALPRFHAYANLVAAGAPSGWGLVRTLPPPPVIADAETIRMAVRTNYAPPEIIPAPPVTNSTEPIEEPQAAPQQFGRKRRTRPDAS